jgi:hypothetical protein
MCIRDRLVNSGKVVWRMAMVSNENNHFGRKRIYWMDNLRTFIIFLVVLYFIGGVYESASAVVDLG